jgi:peptidoglycan/LPS O-acetylase OafA/YrhL
MFSILINMTNTTISYPFVSSIQKKTFDFNLETLRGVAAILVVWGHTTVADGLLDRGYHPTGVWSYLGPAHLSVLVFFLLSGYVIGLAHKDPLTLSTIPVYLKKRFVRIYPIYALCLLLGLAVSEQHYSWQIILSHFTMTQGLVSPVITAIGPSWSLTYEIIFYLLFIPLSVFQLNPIPVALLATLVGCADAYLYPRYGSALLPSFAFGFAFWLSGLALARYSATRPTYSNYAFMVSMLLLFMAIGKLDAPVTLFSQTALRLFGKDLSDLPNDQPGVIAFRDFGYLPYCLLILLTFAGKRFRFQRPFMALLLLLPAPTLYYYYKHLPPQEWATLTLPILFYGLAILFFVVDARLEALGQRLIKSLISTGSISYGLYIVHFSLLYLFSRTALFTGSPLTFTVRLLLFLLPAVAGAYLLEKKFQPWVKKLFF